MKNQYNVIKEKLEQGFWPLTRTTSGFYFLFTEVRTDGCLVCSGAQSSPLEALRPCKINHDVFKAENLDPYDLEIVEYFRPNDLFPSKPFKKGDPVEIKNYPDSVSQESRDFYGKKDLYIDEIYNADEHNCVVRSRSGGFGYMVSPRYIYPRIEKQEECACKQFGTIWLNDDDNKYHCSTCKKIRSVLKNKPGACEASDNSVEDIIGEASVKALEEQGYTITKK